MSRSFDRDGRDRLIKERLMSQVRWVRQSIPLAAMALVSAAPMALAQWGGGRQSTSQGGTQELFEWNGSVDREKQIVMRGSQVRTNDVGRTEPRAERTRTFSAVPRGEGRVVVRVMDGRGNVDVIQQPSSRNNYQTVVRVIDPRSGSDNYRLAAYWEGNGYSTGGVYGRNGNNGNNGNKGKKGNNGNNGSNGRSDYPRRDRNDDGGWDGRNGGGNGSSVMHWSGNVDDELEIRLQNGRATYRTLHGAQPTSVRATNGNAAIPRSNTTMSVVQNQGRGSVTIVQQPSSWNGYTTVLRVKDQQGGYGYYDFDVMAR
jgi:hypothetical protein